MENGFTQPIIKHYQNNRDKYPALKINVVLVSDFLSSSIIDSDSTGANKSDSQIFLQSKSTFDCFPATNIKSDILIPMYHDLIQACDDFEHRGS